MEIRLKLRDLKLFGIESNYEIRNKEAIEEKLSHLEFLELLLEDEITDRETRKLRLRRARANLPSIKKIEEFDFDFQPTINRSLIYDLASCNFVWSFENVILMWQPWTWKTHLAIWLAYKAILSWYKVLFTVMTNMISTLNKWRAEGTYESKMKQYISPDLLVIDELGFKKIDQEIANDLFDIISKRHETKSMIITSNKSFDEWQDIFSDKVIAGAIIDRLVYHGHVLSIKWESYRAQHSKSRKNKDKS